MRRKPARLTLSLAFSLGTMFASGSPAFADQTLTYDGDIPDDGLDHFFIPFDVPAGTVEIEVRHENRTQGNTIDWGLNDPNGYRGWGGGTGEPAVVGDKASSRAYQAGPMPAGKWKVIVGKAQILNKPSTYHVEVDLRTVAKLPAKVGRTPYQPVPAIKTGLRYYAGDFHAHSLESTDASPTIGEMIDFGKTQGLDFFEISDHNTVTQLEDYAAIAKQYPDFLLLPGAEFTTYNGHANAIGATKWVDHKIGQPGVTINGAIDAIEKQGALFSINHPALDIGVCIGCAWKHPIERKKVNGVEISTGGIALFFEPAIQFWDGFLNEGIRVAPIGGSDDHSGGKKQGGLNAGIGTPTTMVLAKELSVAGILEGIRNGRTVVKMRGPKEPMIELEPATGLLGDTLNTKTLKVKARITAGKDSVFHFVKDGLPLDDVTIPNDDFVIEKTFDAPGSGETRIRGEVSKDTIRQTVTGHVWLKYDPSLPQGPVAPDSKGSGSDDSGCSLKGPSESGLGAVLLLGIGIALQGIRRLRRRR